MFWPIKTLSSVRKHLQKVVCFIHFIYSWAFNNNVISNGKSYCCNDTFTDVRFTSLLARIFKKNTNYFTPLESAFNWLFCLKCLFKLVTFSKRYAIKQKWVFFWTQCRLITVTYCLVSPVFVCLFVFVTILRLLLNGNRIDRAMVLGSWH